MNTHAVIEIQGKQYIAKNGDELIVENMNTAEGEEVNLPILMYFDQESSAIEIPTGDVAGTGKVIENVKGDKIRVAKYKSKVRYRKVTGFRPRLTKIQVTKI